MRNLKNYVLGMADEVEKKAGIEVGKITDVLVNERSTRIMGKCTEKGNEYIIEISKFILNDGEVLKSTVLHEILHTVEGCMNHGKKWQQLAGIVSNVFNTDISRTGEATQEMKEERMKRVKYKISCVDCNNSTYRQKRSNLVKYPERFRCRCGGSLEVEIL